MHHALVLSTFSLMFLAITVLSGTIGDPGIQGPINLPDEIPLLQNQEQSSMIHGDIDNDKQLWKNFKGVWVKKGWKDLQAGGWGKRGWQDLQNTGWGKRSWSDLRNGWGKRNRPALQDFWNRRSWADPRDNPWNKRDWNQFRGSWGKRDRYHPDEFTSDIRDDVDNFQDEEDEMENDGLEDEKRTWSSLKGHWGKRDWNNFRGSWGKRDPAWHNLKGLWGKRSIDSKWAKLQGGWGKRSISDVNGLNSAEVPKED